ncbi:MAG: hypothetical protein ABH884_00595 [Candidatus Komeilibacteria bacterium]
MKKFFKGLLICFGILFIIEIIAIAYLWFADPFDLRKYLEFGATLAMPSVTSTQNDTGSNSVMNSAQEAALDSFGIDASVVQNIDAATQKCLTDAVGQARAKEIIDGAAPNAVDFFKAKDCL